jgi:mRNA-degrading endonuclease RelE of RelBE toxin-antitoxin system
MTPRRVEITRAADRDLHHLTVDDRRAIVDAIRAFAAGNSPSADVKKLAGITPPRWRLRVGRFRTIYSIDSERIVILRIGDRRDVYR